MSRRAVLLFVAVLVGLVVASGVSLAASIDCPNCDGNLCVGTRKNDTVTGTKRIDDMRGRGRGDFMHGQNGADNMFGQPGSDEMSGGAGTDEVFGGDNNDQMHGNDGGDDVVDVVNRDSGDTVDCHAGANDTVYVDATITLTSRIRVLDTHTNCENINRASPAANGGRTTRSAGTPSLRDALLSEEVLAQSV